MMARLIPLMASALFVAACNDKPDPRFTTTEHTVADSQTGLTWQRFPSENSMPLRMAATHCADLVLDGWSGFRVPTLKELRTILKRARGYHILMKRPAIVNTVAFPQAPLAAFWAIPDDATLPPAEIKRAMVVDFLNGTWTDLGNQTDSYRVRCVR